MNLDKAQKRLSKLHKRGDHGYPLIEIQYFGTNSALASKVEISFTPEQDAQSFTESFTTKTDIRFDETIQTTLLKIIDRAEAKTVVVKEEVLVLPS
jgi:O-acetylhomoserine/O-acetylserine sulfhydrylase-like pyridoxal-dependent enzyme